MWKKALITSLIGLPAIVLTAVTVNFIKDKLQEWAGIQVPPSIFLLVLLLSLFAVAQVTTQKFFREARESEERRKRERKENSRPR